MDVVPDLDQVGNDPVDGRAGARILALGPEAERRSNAKEDGKEGAGAKAHWAAWGLRTA